MIKQLSDVKDHTPNSTLVEHLERLLVEARKGELRSVYYVGCYEDDSVNHGWCLDNRSGRRKMLAEMVLGQHDFVVNIELQERESVLAKSL